MSKNGELVSGMYIDPGNVDFVKHRIRFDVKQFSDMLIKYKDVIEANKGYARIDVMESKNGKLYGSFQTYKPQPQQEVTQAQHLASRENDDLPF